MIAGNLDPLKSQYIQKLSKLANLKLHLFGPNYTEATHRGHVEYHGTYPEDHIIGQLDGAFGLVWDGASLATRSGETGNCLWFNSIHKLSLYLVADLLVFIWRETVQAVFVEGNGVGILVDSLYEIPDRLQSINVKEYRQYIGAVQLLSPGIRSGEFTKNALKMAEEWRLIEEM